MILILKWKPITHPTSQHVFELHYHQGCELFQRIEIPQNELEEFLFVDLGWSTRRLQIDFTFGLVALRIPFMQIRELGRDRQYGIKESVTNVLNELHKSVDCVPRNVNDSATMKLKKRLSFKSHFRSFPDGSNAFADLNPISSEENDESDIDDNDYDDPFVNPAPAETVINKLNTNIDAGLALVPGRTKCLC
ncbi:hypothetical protein CDAR_192721 [Caerostris darwini]|uniref:Uncharacterized protein n=1 Tax=Caerostris darwini TaxID=1538125 RepID=A0AAV4W2T3_9ARAC|nr:hypothetical protein CDAR_192721 [Caerostris darwini]